jgi:hypothetical protein
MLVNDIHKTVIEQDDIGNTLSTKERKHMKKQLSVVFCLNIALGIVGYLMGIEPLYVVALCMGSFFIGSITWMMIELSTVGRGTFLLNFFLAYVYLLASVAWFYKMLPILEWTAFSVYLGFSALLFVVTSIVTKMTTADWKRLWHGE